MREKKAYHVVGFSTTEQALAWEKYCQDHKIPGRIIPLPEEISAGCGFAYRMTEEEWEIYGKELLTILPFQKDIFLLMY